jgi:hypothetical protein
MSHYFVAGGIFSDPKGNERFILFCRGPGEKPLVMGNGLSPYFIKQIWHHGHLYRVEDDLSLTLIAASPIAIEWGVGAPEKVTLPKKWIERLLAIISLS